MANQWTEGLSKTSIGRFGGFRDDCIPYNEGYLTCSATATRVFLEHDDDRSDELGHYQLPANFRQKTTRTWTGVRYEFADEKGRPHSVVTRSLLFPGFHHRVLTGKFEYYYRLRNFGPTDLILPLESGLKHTTPTDSYDPKRDGKLARPWLFFYFSGTAMPFDMPMLYVFDRHPTKVEVWSHEYLKIHFKGPATVVQVHPFGASRLDKNVTAKWKDNPPADLTQTMDFWARASLAFPSACKESYRIDNDANVMRILDSFTYEESKSEWGDQPLYLAPLPPMLGLARSAGYPVQVRGKLRERLCPTLAGVYEAVEGKEFEYAIPVSRFRDLAPAPVRIVNDPVGDTLTAKLTDYMTSGEYMTFGGDDHYDPNTSLDTLHDLRLMAPALWQLAPEARAKAARHLTRGLKNFTFDEFVRYKTPATGTRWAHHKTIFDYLGEIDYDMEWYNGMNLAGLWAYRYFVNRPGTKNFLEKSWPLIKEINAYSAAYGDWAIMSSWTCCRGEAVWMDGINYAYEGILGYAALARELGKAADADWADYFAAKTEAHLWASWNAIPFVREVFNPQAPSFCVGGWFEGRTPRFHGRGGWGCGCHSYHVRELFLFFQDMNKQNDFRDQEAGYYESFPQWDVEPYQYGKASGYPGSDFRRTMHHYFVDPWLMVKALVLKQDPLDLLNKLRVITTGPVLNCYLDSLAPQLLTSRFATFNGAEWDAKARTLTVNLSAKSGKVTLAIAHHEVPKSVTPAPTSTRQTENRIVYEFAGKGPVKAVLQF